MSRPLHPVLLILLLGAGTAPAQQVSTCRLTMSPTEVRGATYRVALRVSPTCQGQTFRVRKSSTTSLKRDGAPYQPIKPIQGAWTVGRHVNTVPPAELFTLFTWEWQMYQGGSWVRIPQDGRPL